MKINQYYEFCWRCFGVACGLLLIGTAVIADDDGGTYEGPGAVGTATDTTGGGARRSSGKGNVITTRESSILPLGISSGFMRISPPTSAGSGGSDPKQKSNPEPSSDLTPSSGGL